MAKNIILCSDGTGNKGGYGNDSNVFKLYKAVDINDSVTKDVNKQISYYDNGVGTSESGSTSRDNKYWTALSGAFGFGFEDNVVDLYEFLARNYQHGDQIYVFGFSRGAATVRAFTGFVHTCGLIDKSKTADEKAFHKLIILAMDAYKKNKSDPAIAENFKKTHAISGAGFAPKGNLKIHFVGVWDTVSALGFPQDWSRLFNWMFTAMDKVSDKRWPHNFYDYTLTNDVSFAYQAIAIDDERQTFHPKLWNEVGRKVNSVEQVWFAGAHSNVGGGYPRTGLADVAMQWMMTRAAGHGLRFIPDDVSAVETHANVHGKLYDARDGFGIYYRYAPRDINALCKSQSTGKDKVKPGTVKIHETVIDRIKRGTARYAPGYLPSEFKMVSTDPKVSDKKVKFDQGKWSDCQQKVDNWDNKRKKLYSIFVESTVVIVALVIALWISPPDSIMPFLQEAGSNELFFLQRWIYQLLTYILPAIFKNFLTYIVCVHFWIFLAMIATLYGLFKYQKKVLIGLEQELANTRDVLLEKLKDFDKE